jgi:hypothetical protein
MGNKTFIPKNTTVQGAVQKQLDALNKYMSDVADDKSLNPDQIHALVRAANPQMDDLVSNMLDGGGELTNKDAKTMAIAGRIAHAIDKDYTQHGQRRREMRDFAYRQAETRPITADLGNKERQRSTLRGYIGKNAADMEQLVQLAQRLKDRGLESQIPMLNDLFRKGVTKFEGDPDMAMFYAQLMTVRYDSGRIFASSASGTGNVAVHTQKESEHLWDTGLTTNQLKGVVAMMKKDYGNILQPITDEVNQLHERLAKVWDKQPDPPVSDEDISNVLTATETRLINGRLYYKKDGEWYANTY